MAEEVAKHFETLQLHAGTSTFIPPHKGIELTVSV
jgi:hypothetical protein